MVIADYNTPVGDLLRELGFLYREPPCQIKCPVHKLGEETRPSAKYFGDQFVFCYSCGRQYTATEILAAQRGIEREEAAEKLLEKWPATEDIRRKAFSEFYQKKKTPVSKAILDSAEESLLAYRHKVSLELYREWVKRFLQLGDVLEGLEEEDQLLKLKSFKTQLVKEMDYAIAEEKSS